MNLGRLRVASKGVDRAAERERQRHRPRAGTRRRAVPPRHVHDRPGRRAARRDHHHRGAARRRLRRVQTGARPTPHPHPRTARTRAAAARATSPSSACRASTRTPTGCGRTGRTSSPRSNAVIEIPPTHWDWRPYYDPDPRARDKMVSKWGGFMSDIVVRPAEVRHHAEVDPEHRAAPTAPARSGEPGARRRRLPRAAVQLANAPAPSSASAAAGCRCRSSYGFRACMPLLDSIPGCRSSRSRSSSWAKASCPSGPRIRSPASC